MMELTKNDLYEIEKILDIYSGQINLSLHRNMSLSIEWHNTKKEISPNDDQIDELMKTGLMIKEIRQKLKKAQNKMEWWKLEI